MDDPIPCVEMAWHNILAKPEESLVAHTWHVLSRLADQLRLRPNLAKNLGEPNLWHWLYWGTLLHDFGKCASGFQTRLIAVRDHQRTTSWGYRHEALSLAFVDWLFPRGNPDRAHVIAVIACHHKDAREIIETYGYNSRYREYPEDDLAAQLVEQVSPASQIILHRWLSSCAWEWAKALGFAPHIQAVQMPTEAVAREVLQGQRIHDAIEDLHTYTQRMTFKEKAHAAQLGSILRGMILIADHAGSAESRREPFAALDLVSAIPTLFASNVKAHPHQHAATQSAARSTMLMAPTGSGKTESALLWLERQAALDGASPSRTFYILPYQASMNAMHRRLRRHFAGKDQVGLQHGHADQAIYFSALNDDLSAETATVRAKMNEDISRLQRYPLNIQSPYQMLKLPYQLKGHEALFANFQGGRFILDEIHAYEPSRLALIIGFIDFLRRYAAARFFIMSATMPTHVQQALKDAIPDLETITATPETFAQFQRHCVHLLDGSLSDDSTLAKIQADAGKGNSILVCCNTVKRAKDIHALLRQRLPDHPIILVHSRFNARDRIEKEDEIIRQVGVEPRNTPHGAKPIVVATQVVEVSLNIDMDTLYTENAPLEALLQRFGRVNRARSEHSLADVYVVREQPDSVKYLYSPDLLGATLKKLEEVDGTPIDEAAIGTWIDEIYAGTALDQWWKEYRESADRFASDILGALRPFETDEGIEDAFYEMFNGVEVLPAVAFDEYAALIEKGKALEATALLVSLRWAQYKRLSLMKPPKAWREQIKVGWTKKIYVYLVAAEYSSESGLDIEGALQVEEPPEAD